MKRGFTLLELVIAIGILGVMLAFGGVIFNVSIDAYRTGGAQNEIMQKLRAITGQLETDLGQLQKDGYLILQTKYYRFEPADKDKPDSYFHKAQAYFFSTGDFQSWFSNHRSNIARIYFGHDFRSLSADISTADNWRIVHDIILLDPNTAALPIADCAVISYAHCKNNLNNLEDWQYVLNNSVVIDTQSGSATNLHSLMAQNVGSVNIQWTDGTTYVDPDKYVNPHSYSSLAWFGAGTTVGVLTRGLGWSEVIEGDPNYAAIETVSEPAIYNFGDGTVYEQAYQVGWQPNIRIQWPKALKFTFTIYDSKGIIEHGKTFTHIIYLD